ncbi:MAG TPA: TadE/TadG family type IV pilus assembly protein [Chloroflexota bacterium]|jgi:Flp pilus assembly protein TadG
MFRRPGGKRHGGKARRGQSMVEFALVMPVFIFFVFGIIQVALIYQTNSSINQAASDAAHVTATQADQQPIGLLSWEIDRPALAAIRAAMISQNLNNVTSIDIYDAQPGGTAITRSVTMSGNLPAPLTSSDSVILDNTYTPSQATAGDTITCTVDGHFQISDPLTTQFPASNFDTCALPWNGLSYDPNTNQNGRSALRCVEDRVYVKIAYQFHPLPFFPALSITLVGQDSAAMEPTGYLVDANYTVGIRSC